jgi:hypothetical protein
MVLKFGVPSLVTPCQNRAVPGLKIVAIGHHLGKGTRTNLVQDPAPGNMDEANQEIEDIEVLREMHENDQNRRHEMITKKIQEKEVKVNRGDTENDQKPE